MSSSFTAAVGAYVRAAVALEDVAANANREASRAVAIGYLSSMTKRDINEAVRDAGSFDDNKWRSVKVPLSQAWRAIAGEYGFGTKLAEMWASGDFSISLGKAYTASAAPKSRTDNVAKCVKLMLALSPDERNEVMQKVAELVEEAEAVEVSKADKFAALQLVG